MTVEEMILVAKDLQEKLIRGLDKDDVVKWNSLCVEMLKDLSPCKGPYADDYIASLARAAVFLNDGQKQDAIVVLFNEALTGDITYQSRLGSIAWALTGFLNRDERTRVFMKIKDLDKKRNYGEGLSRCYQALMWYSE